MRSKKRKTRTSTKKQKEWGQPYFFLFFLLGIREDRKLAKRLMRGLNKN